MRVAIVASRNLWPTSEVLTSVVAAMELAGRSGTIIIRSDRKGMMHSPVERFVWECASGLRISQIIRSLPVKAGRNGVYLRDYDLVQSVDRVIAYFAPGEEMEGGTGHVVHAAIVKAIPVEALALDQYGHLRSIGSDEGEGGLLTEETATVLNDMYENMERSFPKYDLSR